MTDNKLRFHPFRPNGFAPSTVFTGRIDESVALEQMLLNTLNRNPQHFILHGERGIGKSSLLYIHRLIATGDLSGIGGQRYNYLVVSINVEPTETAESLIRKLGLSLRVKCASESNGKEFFKTSLEFLSRFEAAGVRLRSKSENAEHDPMMTLAEAYSKTCEDIKGYYDGILLIIDEADTAPASAHLGAILKSLSERVALCHNNVLAIGLAGVTNLISILRESHQSSPRLFSGFHLKPLSEQETREVIHKALDEAASINGKATKIAKPAEDMIVTLSEGYPSFIQSSAISLSTLTWTGTSQLMM